jgi:hypothetical protein
MWCRYVLGLNWSNAPSAQELDWDHSAVHQRPTERRDGIGQKRLTSGDRERSRATRSPWWQATQAILSPCSSRDEQGVGIV